MFYDEEMLLDLRLNILNKYVDKFVIAEANYTHNGNPKKLIFDIEKFSKFKDKIIYFVVDTPPPDISKINEKDNEKEKQSKKISNAYKRHIYQLDKIKVGIVDASNDDIIIVSDLDEIPNLEEINFKLINNKLIFFKQKMFYYKLNLFYKSLPWHGSKACKKKYFKSAKWLQWIKNKKYPKWRVDILFSRKKYNDIYFVENGGWHFTNIKSPENIEKKMKNFVHYLDYEDSGIDIKDLKKMIEEKKIIYNHKIDKKEFRWSNEEKLVKINNKDLPEYINNNMNKYKDWLDN